VTGAWKRQYREEFYDLYPPDIISMFKPARMRWAGHVERVGKEGERYIRGFGGGNMR
jgi:hypothetical protein